MHKEKIKTPHPSGTAVLLRETCDHFEVLLVRRSIHVSFHGGAWVFPGGRIEQADYLADDNDIIGAAKNAAVRETKEEAGVDVSPEQLILMSRWTTPEGLPKRFTAWFFVAPVTESGVTIDNKEISAYQWIQPAAALNAQRTGEMELPPPTFVTLFTLTQFKSVDKVISTLSDQQTMIFVPRVVEIEDGLCFLYEGDAGYTHYDAHRPGARHRLWAVEGQYTYEVTAS